MINALEESILKKVNGISSMNPYLKRSKENFALIGGDHMRSKQFIIMAQYN